MAVDARALGRGLRKRCPVCGSGGLFASFFTLRERCPSCGLGFEREDGYWVGAMTVAIAVTEALFGLWFVGGMLLTWPEVPWTPLLVGGVVLNLAFPVLGYPWAKTTWMGLHHAFVPPEASEEADAIAALEAQRRSAAIAARDAAREAVGDSPSESVDEASRSRPAQQRHRGRDGTGDGSSPSADR